MPIKKRDIMNTLSGKGFVKVVSKHHIYFYLRDPDNPDKYITHVRTRLSHGSSKDLSDNILSKMAKQLRFNSKKQFLDYVDCKYTYSDYVKKLKAEGII